MTQNDWDKWQATYCPVHTSNHKVLSYIFQPYGDDLAFVNSCDKLHVWTVVDTDEGERIIEGMRFVNRIGYLVTVRPWSEPTEVTL